MCNNKRLLAILFVVSIIICIFFLYRGNVRIELDMYVDGHGVGQVFYASNGKPFCEKNSISFKLRPHVFKRYTVSFPISTTDGLRIRIDPAKRKGVNVTIREINIAFSNGTKEILFDVDAEKFIDFHQIQRDKRGNNFLKFFTTDIDPWIVMDLESFIEIGERFRVRTASSVLIFFLVLLAFVRFPGMLNEETAAKYLVYFAALVVFILQSYYYAEKVAYGAPPDERAHISYLAHLKSNNLVFPDYQSRFLYTDSGNLTKKLNYLCHPPFYYNLFKPFIHKSPGLIVKNYRSIRVLNVILALIGVMIFMWIGCRENLPLTFHLYYATAIISVPMLSYLAGSVNNDNLTLIGGGLAIYGALLFLENRFLPSGLLCLGFGLSFSLLTKATSGLHVMFFVLLVFVYKIWQDKSFKTFRNAYFVLFVLICLIPLSYYVLTYINHHTFLPSYGSIGFVPAKNPIIYPFTDYIHHFFHRLSFTWTGIHSHESVQKHCFVDALPFLIPPFLALAALFFKNNVKPSGKHQSHFFAVHKIALIATLLFMVVHFIKVYKGHLSTGYLGGIQSRYYFSLIPSLFALSFRPFLYIHRNAVVLIFIGLLVAGFIYAGFFYYLFIVT